MPSRTISSIIATTVILLAFLYAPIHQRLTTFGIIRGRVTNIHGVEELHIISGTTMCEDLHLERTTNNLFTACQAAPDQRALWFPPTLTLTNFKATSGGSLVRIDPSSMTATTLELQGFNGPLVTHGIDILNDPTDPGLLWIYAVNHLPNPDRWMEGESNGDIPPTSSSKSHLPPERARIEIFTHRLGSNAAVHVRSVQHPAIRMPNDILAISPSAFYVTNDHIHHEGLWRLWEDVGAQGIAPSADTVLVEVIDYFRTVDASAGVEVRVALQAVHNNNGLGRGSTSHPEEIVVIDAAGGVMVRTTRTVTDSQGDGNLTVVERVQIDSTLDNPSYYDDAYATEGSDASGYILPGLAHGYRMMGDFAHNDRPIPSVVWHVRPVGDLREGHRKGSRWERKLIFQDDGKALRSASGAVLIGIDPNENHGRKQGWLFVTGFGSFNVVAAKVDL